MGNELEALAVREVAEKLSERAKRVMAHPRFVDKGWEPNDPFASVIIEMIDAGLFTRADGRCGFEAFKDSFIVPTPLGLAVRQALLSLPEPAQANMENDNGN